MQRSCSNEAWWRRAFLCTVLIVSSLQATLGDSKYLDPCNGVDPATGQVYGPCTGVYKYCVYSPSFGHCYPRCSLAPGKDNNNFCGDKDSCAQGSACVGIPGIPKTPYGPFCTCGDLIGSSSSDPLISGFDGDTWEFKGQPGKQYSVYSDAHHAVNMGLFKGQMYDHNGTYIGGVGFRHKDQTVVVTLLEDGNLTLSLAGSEDIHVGSVAVDGTRRLGEDVSVEWHSYEAGLGRTVGFATSVVDFKVWAVPPGQLDEGGVLQPAYLNFRFRMLAPPVGDEAQGLIGETLQAAQPAAGSSQEDSSGHHTRGADEDYEVQGGLLGTQFAFSLFDKPIPSSRRLLQSRLSGLTFPLTVCNGPCDDL